MIDFSPKNNLKKTMTMLLITIFSADFFPQITLIKTAQIIADLFCANLRMNLRDQREIS
jgi:hypothetical protein